MRRDKLHLASFVTPGDVHIASWRQPKLRYERGSDFGMYLDSARILEQAKFDLLLLGDVPANAQDPIEMQSRISKYDMLDPLTVIAALAVTTRSIGLAATGSTTYGEPYHVARRFASIDHLSGGRVAWNLVTTANPTEAWNFSRDEHAAHADRYARAEEFVDVVIGLWESWEEGAFVRDKQSGIYVKPEAIRPLHHRGAHFSVRGPLDIDRTPQGRPVIVQAGSSEPGKNLAARVADVVFTAQQSLAGAQAFYRDLKERVARSGRSPDEAVVVVGMLPVVGDTEEEARRKFDAIQALIHPTVALTKTAELMGNIDLTRYPLDEMLPEQLPTGIGFTSRQQGILDYARRNRMTLRQISALIGGTRGHLPMIGTAASIADTMEQWFTQNAADGFLLFPTSLPEALIEFTETVVPELQSRGLFRTEYEGATLRDNLGVPTPSAAFRTATEG